MKKKRTRKKKEARVVRVYDVNRAAGEAYKALRAKEGEDVVLEVEPTRSMLPRPLFNAEQTKIFEDCGEEPPFTHLPMRLYYGRVVEETEAMWKEHRWRFKAVYPAQENFGAAHAMSAEKQAWCKEEDFYPLFSGIAAASRVGSELFERSADIGEDGSVPACSEGAMKNPWDLQLRISKRACAALGGVGATDFDALVGLSVFLARSVPEWLPQDADSEVPEAASFQHRAVCGPFVHDSVFWGYALGDSDGFVPTQKCAGTLKTANVTLMSDKGGDPNSLDGTTVDTKRWPNAGIMIKGGCQIYAKFLLVTPAQCEAHRASRERLL